jgi:hypothetical protein
MRKIFITSIIGSFLFSSCQNQGSSIDKVSFDSSIVGNTKKVQTTDSPTAQPLQNQVQTLPISTNTPSTSLQTNPTLAPATTVTTAPGMNPAHGQPGHRCDIAVGAPLNSPATKTTTTPATTNPAVTSTITPTAVTTTTGMNPAHGQPGHRCDIAVGAPLNSPATKTTTANTNLKTKPTETVVPATNETVVKDTTTKQKK